MEETKTELITSPDVLTARDEVDIQIATAKKYPRDPVKAMETMRAIACARKDVALEMVWLMPRGGKNLLGPSVRMAEVIASSWGNMRVQTRILETAPDRKWVKVQAVAHDLESNLAIAQDIKQKTTYSNGGAYNDDMMQVATNAAMSKAYRNAIFKCVPRALIEPLESAILTTICGDEEETVERVKKAVAYLGERGVPEQKMLDRLKVERHGEVSRMDLLVLQKILDAVRKGDTTLAEEFDLPADRKPHAAEKPKMKTGKKAAKKTEHKGADKDKEVRAEIVALVAELKKAGKDPQVRIDDLPQMETDDLRSMRNWLNGELEAHRAASKAP